VITTTTEHQIVVAVVDSRTDSIVHSGQMGSTARQAGLAAIAASAVVAARRQQTIGSAIKHNNFCAFCCKFFVYFEMFFIINWRKNGS
jgi:hypothetical protein